MFILGFLALILITLDTILNQFGIVTPSFLLLPLESTYIQICLAITILMIVVGFGALLVIAFFYDEEGLKF